MSLLQRARAAAGVLALGLPEPVALDIRNGLFACGVELHLHELAQVAVWAEHFGTDVTFRDQATHIRAEAIFQVDGEECSAWSYESHSRVFHLLRRLGMAERPMSSGISVPPRALSEQDSYR